MGKQLLKVKNKMRKWVAFKQDKKEPLEKEGYYPVLFGWCANEGYFPDAIHNSELAEYPYPIASICSEPFDNFRSAEKWADENEFNF